MTAPKAEAAGAPMWVVTFADLMALLMCFFVLLLSFSEMDAMKFKELMGSVRNAFGVQRDVEVKDIPKGTSIVAREFSPGKTKASIADEVRQSTVRDQLRYLDIGQKKNKDMVQKVSAEKVKEALKEEIDNGVLEVDVDEQKVVIRIKESGSFPSGSASLIPGFEPVLERIGKVLQSTSGLVVVAGHTDNIPIATSRFRSNWELSASRSVTVVHSLERLSGIPSERFMVEGHAATVPIAENNTAENRARNRRVEIGIFKGLADLNGQDEGFVQNTAGDSDERTWH